MPAKDFCFTTTLFIIFIFQLQMQCLIALLAFVVLSFADANPIRDEPKFCNGLECPHFKTINTTDKYETRCYPTAYKWVSTVVAGRKFVLLFGFPQWLACNFPGNFTALHVVTHSGFWVDEERDKSMAGNNDRDSPPPLRGYLEKFR